MRTEWLTDSSRLGPQRPRASRHPSDSERGMHARGGVTNALACHTFAGGPSSSSTLRDRLRRRSALIQQTLEGRCRVFRRKV